MKVAIVGAGLTGCTIARKLAEEGIEVEIFESRDHIAGNCYDYHNERGELIHKYGPHLMHHSDRHVHNFLSQFTEWVPYAHKVKAQVFDGHIDLPVNLNTLEWHFGKGSAEENLKALDEATAKYRNDKGPANTDELFLQSYGEELSNIFFRPYTKKMWDCPPKKINCSVGARLQPRKNYDDRYFTDSYQYLPKHGYTKMCFNMINHSNIHVYLNHPFDFSDENIKSFDHIFCSAPIDAVYDFRYGELPYRSIKFHEKVGRNRDIAATVNYTDNDKYTRITQWNMLPNCNTWSQGGTSTYTIEEPCWHWENNDERMYPCKRGPDKSLYNDYVEFHNFYGHENLEFIGRCGTYQYLDMHQAIKQGFGHARKFLK